MLCARVLADCDKAFSGLYGRFVHVTLVILPLDSKLCLQLNYGNAGITGRKVCTSISKINRFDIPKRDLTLFILQ
jgi:hypothetical protein